MPQARSSGPRSRSSSGSTSGRTPAKRAAGSRSTGAKQTTRSSSSKSAGSKSTGRSSSRSTGSRSRASGSTNSKSTRSAGAGAAGSATTTDPRLDAVAQRVRKLNERIIEASKDAGEATLSSYEKALKAIASTLERGPGKSDVEWISALATTQAKFIRDVTTAWTSAARGMLK